MGLSAVRFICVCQGYGNPDELKVLIDQYYGLSSFMFMVRELNDCYQSFPALWQSDYDTEGFQWLVTTGDDLQSVIAFSRYTFNNAPLGGGHLPLYPGGQAPLPLGLPEPGTWTEVFNTGRSEFGGSGVLNSSLLRACP